MDCKMLIDGQWVKSSSGEVFYDYAPATRKVIATFPAGNAADVDKAAKSAARAFPAWNRVPAPKRADILLKAALIMEKRKKELGQLVTQEMGKVWFEAEGDVQEAIDVLEYMAGEGRRMFGHTTPSELKDKFCMTVRRPIGVVGVITPWNFPFAIPAWKLAPALVCGNTIVFKPASDSPLCALEFVRILVEAGVPKGVVNLVTGSGSNVGAPMVRHELIRSISFTGSRDIGQFIASEGGHYLKRVTLELGGKNPIIIMDDADLKLAVDGCVWGAFGTTGQRCTAASRIIVHKSVKDSFLRAFVKRAKELRVGDGSKKTMDMGPLVNEDALKKVQRYVDIGRSEGAKLVCGGHAMKGWFFEPTIFDNVNVGMKVAQDEIFGPVVCIIEAKDLDDAIRKANSVEYGLSTAIYTRDVSNAFRAIEGLEAGLTYVNASTIGSEVHLPFGGVKKTGNGTREAGIEGINEFSETKTVYVDYSGRLQRAQIDVD